MPRHHGFVRAVAAACTSGLVLGARAEDPPNFKPDGAFKGSALTGWRSAGGADWTAQNGEIIGEKPLATQPARQATLIYADITKTVDGTPLVNCCKSDVRPAAPGR